MLYITDYGAKGDGITLNIAAFRRAVEAARDTGETVAVPAGMFLTGAVSLQGISLYPEAGAVIKASPNPEDYPDQDFVHIEMGRMKALIVNLRHPQHPPDRNHLLRRKCHGDHRSERENPGHIPVRHRLYAEASEQPARQGEYFRPFPLRDVGGSSG